VKNCENRSTFADVLPFGGLIIPSSATEHSPPQVLWCGTVCQRQSEITAPCQTSNLLWSLTCLLDYILEAAATVTICDGTLESVLHVMAP